MNFLRLSAIDSVLADLRFAWRGMRHSQGFFSIAVLTLALGIGINAAIFSVFSHVLLAPLRFPDPGNLYVVTSHAASLGDARRFSSGPDFRDFRDAGTTLSQVAAAIGSFTEPWTGDGEPRVDPDQLPPFAAICGFTCETVQALTDAFLPNADVLQNDIPMYTDIAPVIQVSEIRLEQ